MRRRTPLHPLQRLQDVRLHLVLVDETLLALLPLLAPAARLRVGTELAYRRTALGDGGPPLRGGAGVLDENTGRGRPPAAGPPGLPAAAARRAADGLTVPGAARAAE